MKKLSRRKLMGGLGAVGTGLWLPLLSGPARTASCKQPPFVITVHAGGGWDPTFFCDPVVDDARYSIFSSAHVLTAGPLNYLPYQTDGDTPIPYMYGGEDFFAKHMARTVVINGVDTQTVSHDVGGRFAHTGSIREGFPTLSALVAGLAGPSLPLSFLTMGAAATAGLVLPTGVNGRLDEIWHTNRDGKFLDPEVHQVVQNARWQRDLDRSMLAAAPLRQANVRALTIARNAQVDEQFVAFSSRIQDFAPPTKNSLSDAGAVTLAAMSEGLCAAAHLSADGAGFDTHSEHDRVSSYGRGHRISLDRTFEGLDYIIDRALAEPVIADRGLLIHVASEFGRTTYNDTGGKDHWPITSNLVIAVGAVEKRIRTNRVVGATHVSSSEKTQGVIAQSYVVVDGEMVEAEWDDPDAFTITPGHLHVALRKALELCDDDLPSAPLARLAIPLVNEEPLPLF